MSGNKRRFGGLLIVLTLVVLVAALLLWPRKIGDSVDRKPTAPSTDWIVVDPKEPAVPVDLPKTPMTNVPGQQPTGQRDKR